MKQIIILICLCFSVEMQSQTTITLLEYWLDGDFAQRNTHIPTTPKETLVYTDVIDVDYLPAGLHTFHFRVMDSEGRWSPAQTPQVFYKSPLSSGPVDRSVDRIEYWVDADFANRVSLPQTPENTLFFSGLIDLSALTTGLHTFHFRAKDDDDRWTPAQTPQVFYKSAVPVLFDNEIIGYRYWFDDDIEHYTFIALETPVNPYEMTVDITVPKTLAVEEDHSFHIQFQDAAGKWSMQMADMFYYNTVYTVISLPKANTTGFSVYPNPFTDQLNVMVKDAKPADIALYSAAGDLLSIHRNRSEVQISASQLPAGVYVVKVTIEGKVESQTVVKKSKP